MGVGCESVVRGVDEKGMIKVTGIWKGGRTGVFLEGKGYSGIARGENGEAKVGGFDGYQPLVAEVIQFFKSGKAPVPAEETIELFAFMEAADESKRRGGKSVKIAEVMKTAKASQ